MALLTGIESLMPIKGYLSIFNTVITVFLNLSPALNLLNVEKGKEDYKKLPAMMFIFLLLNNAIWGCYWHRKSEFSGFICSYICGTIATIYLIWYLYYVAERKSGKFLLFVCGQFLIEGGIILFFLSEILSLPIVGVLLIIINTLQYVAPAQNLLKAIKDKDCNLIPIVPTLLGLVCSGGWLLFALIIGDINCFIPNGLGCISSIITSLVWFWIRSKSAKKEDESQEGEELINKDGE